MQSANPQRPVMDISVRPRPASVPAGQPPAEHPDAPAPIPAQPAAEPKPSVPLPVREAPADDYDAGAAPRTDVRTDQPRPQQSHTQQAPAEPKPMPAEPSPAPVPPSTQPADKTPLPVGAITAAVLVMAGLSATAFFIYLSTT